MILEGVDMLTSATQRISAGFIAILLAACAQLPQQHAQAPAVATCFGSGPASDAAVAAKHGISIKEVRQLRELRGYDDERFCLVASSRVKRHAANLGTTKLARAEGHPSREYLLMLQRSDDGQVKHAGYVDALQARARMVEQQTTGAKLGGLANRNWIALGPFDVAGRIKAILVDPDNPQQIWVGAATGGIWRSTDGGNSWLPIDDFFASPSVQTLVMDSQNRNVMYAGTGEGATGNLGTGILKSTDRGRTWQLLEGTRNIQYVYRIATHPTQTNILVAATDNGVIRSVDGGATWATVLMLADFGTYVDIAYDPNNASNLIAGGQGGVYVSRDGGLTWRARNVVNPMPTEAPFPGRVEIEYAKSQANLVYASVDLDGGQIYRSQDNGETWTFLSNPKHVETQGGYNNTLWVDPTNANLVVASGIDVYRSVNGGTTFTKIADWARWPQSAHADHHYMVAHPNYNGTTNRQVWLGGDGGMYLINDIMAVSQLEGWVAKNNNLQVTQFYHGSGQRNQQGGILYGGTQDNGTPAALGSAPRTWSVVVGGDGGFSAPDPTDPNRFFGTLQNGGLFRQNINNPVLNRGNQYICRGITEVFPQFCGATNVTRTLFITPIAVDLRTPTRLYLGADSLWASDNANAEDDFDVQWRIIKPAILGADGRSAGTFIAAIGIAPSDSNIVYVGHSRGQLFRSNNALSANPTFAALPGVGQRVIRSLVVDRQNPQKLYMTLGGFDADNVQVSSDGGQTWRSIASNLPAAPVHALVVNPLDARKLYVATQVGVFATEDEGGTWSASNAGPGSVPVFNLFFYDNTNLIAATFGRGMWQIDLTGTSPDADSDADGVSNRIEALENRNPAVKDNDIFANPRLFVMQMYRDFLTREGDAGGINFWVGRINRGERSRAQMAEEYVNSQEFQGRVAPVVRASFAINRAIPDFMLTFQRIAQRDAGRSIEQIGQDIFAASPLVATYNAQAEPAFIAGIYNDLLARTATAAEVAAASMAIGSVGRGGFIARVANSEEYSRRSSNQVYVTMMYMGMLRRAPEQGGFDFWVGVMNGGQSGLGLVQAFLDAAEYRNRFLAPR
jgi:photosystem II stability/assembly factor-like uncharacterized protein